MEIIMKRTLFLSLITGLTALAATVAQADFFAYQKWVHPVTGNKVHLFFDQHVVLDKINVDVIARQQVDFVATAKSCGQDTLVLVEDIIAMYGDNPEEAAKGALKKLSIEMFSPLVLLFFACKEAGVDVINVEGRLDMPSLEQKVLRCNNSVLTSEMRCNIAQKIMAQIGVGWSVAEKADFESDKAESICVDNYIVSLIRNHSHKKNIFVAAGASHLLSVACFLSLLGYLPEKLSISRELQQMTKTAVGAKLNSFLETLSDVRKPLVEAQIALCLKYLSLDGERWRLSQHPINISEIFEAQLKSNDAEHKSAAAACAVPAQAVPAQAVQPRSRL
jgi:hypothetical protein